MNKGITIAVLGVLLCAMGLVFYTQMQQPPTLSGPVLGGSVPEPTGPTVYTLTPQSIGQSPSVNTTGGGPAPVVVSTGTNSELPKLYPPVVSSAAPVETEPKAVEAPKPPSAFAGASLTPIPMEGKKPEEAPKAPVIPIASAGGKTEPAKPAVKPEDPKVPAKPTDDKTPAKPGTEGAKPPVKPTADTQKTPVKPGAEGSKVASTERPVIDPAGKRTLKDISLQISGKQVTLYIEADTAMISKTFALVAPDRLVVDLPGTWQGMRAPAVPKNNIVKSARVGSQPSGPRLVLDLERPSKFETATKQGEKVVEIRLQ